MSASEWRYDYCRFRVECSPDAWEGIYRIFCDAATKFKVSGDFESSHKTNRLWYDARMNLETWAIDVWGPWSLVVVYLPVVWFYRLTRFDVRQTLWEVTEDDVINTGQALQRAKGPLNVHTHSSRKASKRLGRDRGGVGFAIGSHKSDTRISVYKRGNEPTAHEVQMQGKYLEKLKSEVDEEWGAFSGTITLVHKLRDKVVEVGRKRLTRSMEHAGLGTYWPTRSPQTGAHDFGSQRAIDTYVPLDPPYELPLGDIDPA